MHYVNKQVFQAWLCPEFLKDLHELLVLLGEFIFSREATRSVFEEINDLLAAKLVLQEFLLDGLETVNKDVIKSI